MNQTDTCPCPVCAGRDFKREGIELADKEIIPFIKNKLLNVKYPDHPFPLKYGSIAASCFAYSQVVCFARNHSSLSQIFYTENKILIEHKDRLCMKFGVEIRPVSEAPSDVQAKDFQSFASAELVLFVCEFNLEDFND